MENNENMGFHIEEDFEETSAEETVEETPEETAQEAEEMPETDAEEIYSDSTAQDEFIGLSSYSDVDTEKEYKKKKRGFAGWWKNLTGGKKALLITVTALVLVFATLLIMIWPYINYNRKEISSKPEDLGFKEVIKEEIVNIALFGIDTRDKESFKGNSDSMMVLSINTKTKKVKIISLMRDTFVPIEVNGKTTYGKLNAAYGGGGPERGVKTINKIFGLDISEYATINFFGMVDIIDAVGGIDATITEDELAWKGYDHPNLNGCMQEICSNLKLNTEFYYIKEAGPQHLNGVQAVAYSRVRHCKNTWGTNNDYGRTDRQRYVMEQLFTKAINLKKSDYPKLAKALIPCSQTSLSLDRILELSFNVLLEHPTFEQYRIPQEDFLMPFRGPSSYGSVVYIDLDYCAKAIHSIIYDDMTLDAFIAANPVEKNDWFGGSGGGSGSGGGGGTTSRSTGGETSSAPETSSATSSSESETPSGSTPSTSSEESSSGESSSEESKPDTPGGGGDTSSTTSGQTTEGNDQ